MSSDSSVSPDEIVRRVEAILDEPDDRPARVPSDRFRVEGGSKASTMNSAAKPFQPSSSQGFKVVGYDEPMRTEQQLFTTYPPATPPSHLFSRTPITTPSTPYRPSGSSSAGNTPQQQQARARDYVSYDNLKKYTLTQYGVIVNNLEPRTQNRQLMTIFFPLGAVDAVSFASPVGDESVASDFVGRRGGLVLFASREMAEAAAAKIDDFVPHGQTLPLHVYFFGRFEDFDANRERFSGRPDAIRRKMHVGDVDTLTNALKDSIAQSPADAVKAAEALLARLTRSPRQSARIVSAVCGCIVQYQDDVPHADEFLKHIVRFVVQQGVLDAEGTQPHPVRIACAEICAAMFEQGVLRGCPFAMALRITSQTVDLDGDEPLPAASCSLLEALGHMTATWAAAAPAGRTPSDEEAAFGALLTDLTATGRYFAPSRPRSDDETTDEEGTGRSEHLGTPAGPSRHNISVESATSAVSSVGPRHSVMATPEKRSAPATLFPANPEGSTLHSHILASTVYMTKIPVTLPAAVLRRVFSTFGEFNKVRVYDERGPKGNLYAPSRGSFGFVEFVVPASAKAMVDFFRNPSTSASKRMGLSSEEYIAVFTMRVSFARSCIHDTDADDAVFNTIGIDPEGDNPGRKVRSCIFGLN